MNRYRRKIAVFALCLMYYIIAAALTGCERSNNINNETSTNLYIEDTAAGITTTTEETANAVIPYQLPPTPYLNVLWQTTGNKYIVSNDDNSGHSGQKRVEFSYDYGKYTSELSFSHVSRGPGVYISSQKTAVVYILSDMKSIQITYSDDMGKTWNDSEPILPSNDYYIFPLVEFTDFSGFVDLYIDFPTPDCGYILICGGTAMMVQNTRDMFKTVDGGKTWSYIKSNIETGGPPIQSMYFEDSNVGYLCSFIGAASWSYIQRTSDGGKTWTDVTYKEDDVSKLNIPEKYSRYDGNPYWCTIPQTPYFIDNKGYLPVIIQAEITSLDLTMVIFFTSNDNGVTWTYEPSFDTPLSDYANPVALPGCSEFINNITYKWIPTPYFDILWQTTGNSCSVHDNKRSGQKRAEFSYDYGKYTTELFFYEYDYNAVYGCYVSSQKTAVAYIPKDKQSIQIKYSDDMGKTWSDSQPILPSTDYDVVGEECKDFSQFDALSINFPTPDCGYIIINGSYNMHSYHARNIFKTTDGGKTWSYIKSTLDGGGGIMTGFCFTDKNVGYICTYVAPASQWFWIQRTEDGGVTWTDYDNSRLNIPEQYDNNIFSYYSIPCMPYFIGGTGYLAVILQALEISPMVIFFTSTDNGVTWTYEPSLDTPLSDYANPVALPGCEKPPIIDEN